MRMLLLVVLLLLSGCAGTNVLHVTPMRGSGAESTMLIFPLRDPSLGEKTFPGVGGRFSQAFARAAARFGVTLIPIASSDFSSSQDIDVSLALAHAQRRGAGFIVTGEVTKWVDRATGWSGKRDFAGIGITVREVPTGRVIASIDVEEHSNNFWSGVPDDYVLSLADRAAAELFASDAVQE